MDKAAEHPMGGRRYELFFSGWVRRLAFDILAREGMHPL